MVGLSPVMGAGLSPVMGAGQTGGQPLVGFIQSLLLRTAFGIHCCGGNSLQSLTCSGGRSTQRVLSHNRVS